MDSWNQVKSPQPDMTRKMSGPDSVLALSFVLFFFPSKNFLKTVLNIIQGYAPKWLKQPLRLRWWHSFSGRKLIWPLKSEGEVAQSVWLFATPWTVAHQAPQSVGFSRQEYWSGLPCTPPGDLPDPGIEPGPPSLQNSLPSEPPGKPTGSLRSLVLNLASKKPSSRLWTLGCPIMVASQRLSTSCGVFWHWICLWSLQ